jgi:hypothetical protein
MLISLLSHFFFQEQVVKHDSGDYPKQWFFKVQESPSSARREISLFHEAGDITGGGGGKVIILLFLANGMFFFVTPH